MIGSVFWPFEDYSMHPLQVAAHFAAFTWYARTHPKALREDAAGFARTKWADFLPVAHEGLGRFLLQIASSSKPRREQRL
jgi:hypothetical protein